MRKLQRGMLAAAVAGLAIFGFAVPANAGALYDSNTAWFGTANSNTYYVAMTISTNAGRTSATRFRINNATTTGGVYYHGPYGDSPQKATSLTQKWTITASGAGLNECSIGFPSGFNCSVHSKTQVVSTDSTNFGASKPTSTGTSATTLIDEDGSISKVKFQSDWKAGFKINGTTAYRTVGDNNIH